MDWIDIKNKLPEHNQWCLTWWDGCKLPLTAIFKKAKKKGSFIGIDGESWMASKDEITHWMPVPEEPRDGKNVVSTESKLNLADVTGSAFTADDMKHAFCAGEEFANECKCGECHYCTEIKVEDALDFEDWIKHYR